MLPISLFQSRWWKKSNLIFLNSKQIGFKFEVRTYITRIYILIYAHTKIVFNDDCMNIRPYSRPTFRENCDFGALAERVVATSS